PARPWSDRMKRQQTAERRQVTVLHVDIVNSTALIDELDPEEVMGLMQSYVDSCKTFIDEFHGSLAGYTGDGFEAYFGYPIAGEEAAATAVNEAIRFGEMRADGSNFPFDCRIGIATGRVVVDRPGIRAVGRNLLAFGTAPHLAARLQQAASPGHVLVDRPTMKLCESKFDFRSIGPIHSKDSRRISKCSSWARRCSPVSASVRRDSAPMSDGRPNCSSWPAAGNPHLSGTARWWWCSESRGSENRGSSTSFRRRWRRTTRRSSSCNASTSS